MESQWVSINCEAKGRGHQICQDKTACLMGKVNVVALADGLTSCALSHEGARIVTQWTCQELRDHFWDYYNAKLSPECFVDRVQRTVMKHCRNPWQYDQMCSTLLFCAVSEGRYLLGHIGDGAILQFGLQCRMISPPQENKVGGTATYTILDPDAGQRIEFHRGSVEDCDGFLLTSDGLKGNAYCGGTVLPQHAFDLFYEAFRMKDKSAQQRNREMGEALSEIFANRTEDADDCSLGILSRTVMTGHVDYEKDNGVDVTVGWPCVCGNNNQMNEIRCGKCRRERSVLYECVELSSQEYFFDELNQWLVSGEPKPAISRQSGKILDKNRFSQLCCELRWSRRGAQPSEKQNPCRIRVSKAKFQRLMAAGPERETLSEEELAALRWLPKREKALYFVRYTGGKKEFTHLFFSQEQVAVGKMGEDVELTGYDSVEDAVTELAGLNTPAGTALKAASRRWIIQQGGERRTPLEQIIQQIILMRDNSLLCAEGEQYRWLYQIDGTQPMLEIRACDREGTERSFLAFLYGKVCTWCILARNGDIAIEALDDAGCRKYFETFCREMLVPSE